MPELETRFAQIPDWLNYNQPAVPSFLQTREDNRRQAESGRAERALQMREELQPYLIENQRIDNETAKAALDYTMQTRAAEARAAAMATQIEKLPGGWGSIEALTMWQNEVLRNPAIANSKVGEVIGRNIGTALQYGKTLEDAKRKLEFEQQRNALTEERYRLQAEQAQTQGRTDRNSEVNRRFLFGKQLSRIQKQIDVIDKDITLSNEEKARRKDPLLRQQTALEFAFDKGQDLVDALDSMEAPAPAPEMDEAEKLFAEMRKNLKLWRAQGKTSGTWKSDGTIAEPGYFTNDMDLDELEAELNRREAAYRKDSGSAPQSTPSGGVILKRSDIFKK